MNDLKVFSSTEFGELGVMLIDGKEYFPATQCAKILGYKEPQNAVRRHCVEGGCVKRTVIDRLGRTQEMKYISEGNLYRLIVSSKLPAAKKFERWVFDEVLPSIRQTGGYGSVNIEQVIAQTATAVVSEVMKQLVPVLTRAVRNETEPEEIWEEPVPRKKNRSRSIITSLSPALREAVDGMLERNASYAAVADFLRANGIGISQTSVCRYYNAYIK